MLHCVSIRLHLFTSCPFVFLVVSYILSLFLHVPDNRRFITVRIMDAIHAFDPDFLGQLVHVDFLEAELFEKIRDERQGENLFHLEFAGFFDGVADHDGAVVFAAVSRVNGQ